MTIDWDSLDSFDDWSAQLARLLNQAKGALQSGDAAQRAAVEDLLGDFIAHSPDRIAARLDDIARKTMDDMLNQAIAEALKSLDSRSAELALHTDTVAAVTEAAGQAARSIRLEKAQQAIASASDAVASLAGLRQALTAGASDQAVAAKIDAAVGAIQELVPLVMQVKAAGNA